MIIYEPTTDIEFITKCVTEPITWRAGVDDGMIDVNPDMFFVPTDGKLWLRAGDYGLFMGEPRNSVTYEVHTMLLPEARGKALDIAKGALHWMFYNTPCLKIITHVPSFNALARRLSERCGMKLIGNNESSFLKGGVLYDQFIYGISKEDLCHFQQ